MLRFLAVPTILVMFASPAMAQVAPSHSTVEGELCRAQLELLVGGEKLMPEERERFEAQCACLEKRASSGDDAECAEDRIG